MGKIRILTILIFFALFLCSSTAFFFSAQTVFAAAGINKQINFQGKLVNADGTNVTDGSYTVVFTMYSVFSGGSSLWTESDTVTTTSGIFQVALGAVTTLPSSIDFNTDTLYLGIKISTESSEMTPRIRMTAVPYAFNSNAVNGLTFSGTSGNTYTFPGTNSGTVLTSNAPTQTLTSTQTSGTILGMSDVTTETAAVIGQSISLTGGGAFDQTGLSITLSGATGTNLNALIVSDGTNNNVVLSKLGVLTLGNAANTTGKIIFAKSGGGNTGTTTLQAGAQTATNITYTFPTAAPQASQILSSDVNGNLSWITNSAACTTCLVQVPGTTAANTVTPTVGSVIGLTVNATSGTAATAAIFNQSQSGNDGIDINLTNTSGSVANGLSVTSNGASGTTTNGINITQSGTSAITNGLTFTGTFTNIINAPTFKVTNAGDITANATASISGNLTLVNGNIGTTSKNTLSLGDANTGNIVMNGGGNVGIGLSNPLYPFQVSTNASSGNDGSIQEITGQLTDSTHYQNGLLITPQAQPGSASVQEYDATKTVMNGFQNTNLDSAFLVSLNSAVYFQGTGTLGTAYAGKFTNTNASTGTITSAITGLFKASVNSGGGVITNSAGIAVEDQTVATNNTNVLIGTSTIPVGPYSIYNSSAKKNYFAGNVGIGTNNATIALAVKSVATTGNILTLGAPSATTLSGALTSQTIDDSTNYTVTNQSATGLSITLPAPTNTNTTGTNQYRGLVITDAGTIVQNGVGGTTTYAGVDITNANITQTAGTITSSGLNVTTGTVTTGGTQNGLSITPTTIAAGTLNAINIGNAAAGGTTTAINISNTSFGSVLKVSGVSVLNGSGALQSAALTGTYSNALIFGGTMTRSNGGITDFASSVADNTNIFKIPQKATTGTCGTGVAEGLIFQTTGGTQVGHMCINGPTAASNPSKLSFYALAFNTTNTDLAENYSDLTNSLESGDLVSLNPNGPTKSIQKASSAYDPLLIGVVSTSPGLLLSGIDENNAATDLIHPKAIALSGRIPVKVSSENGVIHVGDPLTSSTVPGVAMKATQNGPIIGKALEAYTGIGIGKILVFTEKTTLNTSMSARVANSIPDFTNISVSGLATISGSLRVEGPTALDNTLTALALRVTHLAEFLDKTIFHNDVLFLGRPTFNKDTAGFATIQKNADHVTITFEKEYDQLPIINATLTLDQSGSDQSALQKQILNAGYTYLITQRSTKGFTILLNKAAAQDLSFSWISLAVNTANTFHGSTNDVINSPQPAPTPLITPSPLSSPSVILLPTPSASASATPLPLIVATSSALLDKH